MTYDEIIKFLEREKSACGLCQKIMGKSCTNIDICTDSIKEIARIAYEAGQANMKQQLSYTGEANRNYLAQHSRGYSEGYEAAAKDPKAWWVPDKNGEPVHMFEKVKLSNNKQVIVQGLSDAGILASSSNIDLAAGYGYYHFETNYFEKVTPYTKETIIKGLSQSFKNINKSSYPETMEGCRELANIWYDRIAAQVKAELGDA